MQINFTRSVGTNFIKKGLSFAKSFQTVEKVQPMLGFFHYLCYNNHG